MRKFYVGEFVRTASNELGCVLQVFDAVPNTEQRHMAATLMTAKGPVDWLTEQCTKSCYPGPNHRAEPEWVALLCCSIAVPDPLASTWKGIQARYA
jgi:hypothetical protein